MSDCLLCFFMNHRQSNSLRPKCANKIAAIFTDCGYQVRKTNTTWNRLVMYQVFIFSLSRLSAVFALPASRSLHSALRQ